MLVQEFFHLILFCSFPLPIIPSRLFAIFGLLLLWFCFLSLVSFCILFFLVKLLQTVGQITEFVDFQKFIYPFPSFVLHLGFNYFAFNIFNFRLDFHFVNFEFILPIQLINLEFLPLLLGYLVDYLVGWLLLYA